MSKNNQYSLFPEEGIQPEIKTNKSPKKMNKEITKETTVESVKINNDREIDIRDVFSSIGRFFSNSFNAFGRGIMNIILFVKKHRKVIGSTIALGIIGGLAYSLLGRAFYSSTMVVKSNDNYLEKNVFTKILDELNTMCDEEDHEELAQLLGISTEQAKMLRSFDLEEEKDIVNLGSYYSKYYNVLSTVENEEKRDELLKTFIQSEKDNIYYISVTVYDASVLPLLNEPLAKLMDSNPYFVRNRQINKTALEENGKKILAELFKLDSLRTTLLKAIETNEKNMKSGSNNIFLGETQLYNPLPVHEKYISLYTDAIEINKKIMLNENTVDVLSGFAKLAKNERLHPVLSALAGAGIGLLGGIFLMLGIIAVEGFKKLGNIQPSSD